MRQGKTPLFFVRQGKAPEEILQNVAGSPGHVTASLGTMCLGFLCRKQGKFILVNEKWPMWGLEEGYVEG